MPPARTHTRSTSTAHATCTFGRCSVSGPRPQVIKHEVHEHFSRRFFCCACDKTLSSFESLRTHANSQHYRNRLFKCETCKTTYLDPARLAKCRKRHRGQFRCPETGCQYHNARKNSVVRHLRTQHHHSNPADDSIPFDDTLFTIEPPKQRRVGSSSSTASSVPGSVDASFLNLSGPGPSDEELFRMSENKRRVEMEKIRRQHIEWVGSEAALLREVPDYPSWTQREHPYGRTPSAEPEARESDDSSSTPEVLVSSPIEIGWTAESESPPAGSSSGLLLPSISLCQDASSPQWSGVKHQAYSDVPLANYTSPSLPFALTSTPSLVPDTLTVPSMDGASLFSPHNTGLSSPLLSPGWEVPLTPPPTHSVFPPNIMYGGHTPSSAFGSQFSDDSSSSSTDSFLFASPNPAGFDLLQHFQQQQAFVPEVKSEYTALFPDFLDSLSER